VPQGQCPHVDSDVTDGYAAVINLFDTSEFDKPSMFTGTSFFQEIATGQEQVSAAYSAVL
jgi:hypothetical protein